VLRWLSVIQLYTKVKLIVNELIRLKRTIGIEDNGHALVISVELLDVDLGAELDDVSESDCLFRVPHKERLGDKRCVLVKNLRLQKSVEVCAVVTRLQITPAFEVVRVRVVHFFVIFVEDLKLHEIDALLEKVYIAEVLNMKHKLGACPVHSS